MSTKTDPWAQTFDSSMQFLNSSLEAFKTRNRQQGYKDFQSVFPPHQYKIYEQIWINRRKPLGNPEFGRQCFHDTNGLFSTLEEKAAAIDKYLRSALDEIDRFSITCSNEIHLNKEATDLLKAASNGFKLGSELDASTKFIQCRMKSPEHTYLTYYFLWWQNRKPEGDPEYGSNAFWRLNGKSSTIAERLNAIDLTLTFIEKHEALFLQAAEQNSNGNQSWWETNKETVLTTIAVGGMAVTVAGSIIALIKGRSVPEPRLRGFIPGHIVVGGGHMDSALQRMAYSAGNLQNRIMRGGRAPTDNGITLCKSKDKKHKSSMKGNIKGTIDANRDSQGKGHVQGQGSLSMEFDHENGNKSRVDASVHGRVDQNGNVSGGARVDYSRKF